MSCEWKLDECSVFAALPTEWKAVEDSNPDAISRYVSYLLVPSFLFVASYLPALQVVDGAEWLYKEPLLKPEAVSRMSRAVEQRSRAMGPTSKL